MLRHHHRTILRAAILLALVVSAGCVHAQAKTVGPDPVLTTPDPPARVLIPVPPESLLPPPTPTPEPTPTPTAGRPPVVPPRATPAPTTTPVPTPTPVENPQVLQTANMGALEVQARERLERAEKDFAKLKRDNLGPDARDNYDVAARYIRQAHQALNDKNFPFAKTCADKAAIIAGLLIKLEFRS